MRIQIRDQELRLITPNTAKLSDLAALQTQTAMKMKQIQDLTEGNETVGIQIVVFLSMRNAGQFITFEAAGNYTMDEITPIPDPVDPDAESDQVDPDADPTPARTASAPGAAPAPAKPTASPRSRPRTGSRSRSAPGS